MTLSVDLRHRFPGFALEAAFEAPPGVTALFGRSGSGKTTTVNALAGLLRPDEGRAAVNGWTLFDTRAGLWLPPHRRRVGCVFQEGRLFPHLSVRANLLYGRWFSRGTGGAEVSRVVEMLGLGGLLARRPGALSGGEKQRVALGRALLSRPRLLLMDEPLAALDAPRKAEILPYLERLRDEAEAPILYVSHSVAEVARLATTLVLLEEGRVLRAGPADEVLSDPEAAPLLGIREAGSLLSAQVARHHDDGLTEVATAGGPVFLPRLAARPGARLRIRIEAKDVILARERPEGLSALNILPGRVAALRRGEGPGVLVQLSLGGGERLLARVTRRSAGALGLAPGAACWAVVKSVSVARRDVGEG
jgi:molybdate transport system ATP-binding protein